MTSRALFIPGQLYHRRGDIHDRFGGQQRGGMITPSKHNIIFLVTGNSGRQHGYEDHWSKDGKTFFYYGKGQVGDMKLTSANRALLDHSSNGEDVHLFEEVPKQRGFLRYRGQVVCVGSDWVEAPDTTNKLRKAVLFELVPQESLDADFDGEVVAECKQESDLASASLAELRKKALANSANCRTPHERRVLARLRSQAIRLYVLKRAAGKCEGCGQSAPFRTLAGMPYLEPHHIRRLSDGGPDHPRWVAGVCPNCHRRAHYSHDAVEFNFRLANIVAQMEQ